MKWTDAFSFIYNMIHKRLTIGHQFPIEVGILCSNDMADVSVLNKIITHLSVSIKRQMRKIKIKELLPGEDIDAELLGLLECDFVLLVLSIDFLADDRTWQFLDLLFRKLSQTAMPIEACYIYARTVNIENVPQPPKHILIKPRQPLVLCENQDECYEHLCELLALIIELITIKLKSSKL